MGKEGGRWDLNRPLTKEDMYVGGRQIKAKSI